MLFMRRGKTRTLGGMSDLVPFYAAAFGVLLGSAILLLVNRWLMAIMIARRERNPIFPLALVHSGLWALVGTLAFTGYILLNAHEPWWLWFFSAFYFVPVCIYSYAVTVVL